MNDRLTRYGKRYPCENMRVSAYVSNFAGGLDSRDIQCELASRPFVVADHFVDNEAQELLAEFGIEVSIL